MKKLGKKRLTLELERPVDELPQALAAFRPQLAKDKLSIVFSLDGSEDMSKLLKAASPLSICDVETHESSLEEIFVELTHA